MHPFIEFCVQLVVAVAIIVGWGIIWENRDRRKWR